MKGGRVFFDPAVLGRRTRTILFWYAVGSAALTALVWWRMEQFAVSNGLLLDEVVKSAGPLARILYSAWGRTILVAGASFVAAGITIVAITSPIHRIEDWLTAWEVGLEVKPLRVRAGDAYETLIRLLNELHDKMTRPARASTRVPAGPALLKPARRPRAAASRAVKSASRRSG